LLASCYVNVDSDIGNIVYKTNCIMH